MKLISKLTLRYIQKNKMRTVLTLLGIIISIAMLVSIGIIIESYRDQMIQDSIDFTGDYDFVSTDPTRKDVKDLGRLSDIKNTYKLKSDKIYRAHYYDEELNYNYYSALKIVEAEKEYYDEIMPYGFIVEGRKPTKENEILVPYELRYLVPGFEKIGNIVNLKLSDSLDDFTGMTSGFSKKYIREMNGEDLIDNSEEYEGVYGLKADDKDNLAKLVDSFTSEKNYKIVGYHSHISYNEYSSYLDENRNTDNEYAAYTQFILSYSKEIKDNYNLFGQFANYSNLDKNREIIESNENDISLNTYLVSIKSPEILEYYEFFAGFAITLMSIILVAVILFVYNIFTSNYVERLRDLGLLKITGFSNSQIIKMVLTDSLFYFIVSVPLGFLAAHIGMKVVFTVVNTLLSKALFDQAIQFEVLYNKYIAMGVISVAFLVIFLSNIISAIFVLRRSPIETLEGKAKLKEDNFRARNKRVTRKLLGFEGFLASRNIDRNRKRFILTTLSVTMSIILFVVISSLTEFTNNDLVDSLVVREKVNAEITAETEKEILEKDLEAIKSVDIKYNRNYLNYNITLIREENSGKINDNDDIVTNTTFEVYDDKFFERNVSKEYDAIFYSDLILDELEYKIDNQGFVELNFLPFEYNENYIESENEDYYIFKNGEEFKLKIKVVQNKDLNNSLYSTSDNIVLKESKKDDVLQYFNDKYLYQKITVFGVERTRFNKQDVYELQTLLKKYPSGYVSTVDTPWFTIIKIFVYGFIALIVSIGAINIVNATYTNTLTRRRELALIQTVGLEKKRLKKIVLYENLISIIISGLLSLFASSALIFSMFNTTYENLDGDLARDLLGNFKLPLMSWAIATTLSALLIYIFVTLPYNRMMKESITDVLK